jgi:hypothetical protein
MTMNLQLLHANDSYFGRILKWKGLLAESVGQIYKFKNADDYNYLVDINKVFSQSPKGQPIDRTGLACCPVKYHIDRPWTVPTQQKTLDQALQARVVNLSKQGQKINVFWSGGIDSTTMVTAFLRHLENKNQLRILYSPWSTYEHPGYIDFLKKFPGIELIDVSGTVYMDTEFDGIFLTGDGGDELSASLDESFFIKHGYDALFGSWKDFFYKHNPDDKFINFCDNHFAQSGREINTVLEARWWFYTVCKNTSILYYSKIPYFLDYKNFRPDIVQGFYNCKEYEDFIYWNTDQIIASPEYTSWKHYSKLYCYEFDGFENWYKNKGKFGSSQTGLYTFKKIVLKNIRFLMILSDGRVLRTPHLPFITVKEYQEHCGEFDYLFGNDNQI